MTWQVIGWLVLLLGGFAYNKYVAAHIRRGTGDFMARFVALGVMGVVGVQVLVAPDRCYDKWEYSSLLLIALACGGAGMAWGSWQRSREVE